MKISAILKAGAALASTFYPPLAGVIPIVNAFLPNDQQINESSTGLEVQAAIKTLPPGQQEMILSAEIDLKKTEVIEHTKVIEALADADSTGNSTRPKIAEDCSKTVNFVVILIVSMWAYSVLGKDAGLLKTIQDSWQMILAIIVPLLTIIRAYFGMRTDEKNTRQHTANGMSAPLKGFAKIISAIRK